jgi:Ca2+-binding RTX toxin-like protein
MVELAQGGHDRLFGGAARDLLYGDAGNMFDLARGGDDLLEGGVGDDQLHGDALSLRNSARGGNDWLFGGSGNDALYGDARLIGSDIPEAPHCGDDLLVGGVGNDVLAGDFDPNSSFPSLATHGTDRFVFARGSNLDTILDFEDDKDVIGLSGFVGIAGFAQVQAQAGQTGTDVVIDLGAAAGGAASADVLRLMSFNLADLNAADFTFA